MHVSLLHPIVLVTPYAEFILSFLFICPLFIFTCLLGVFLHDNYQIILRLVTKFEFSLAWNSTIDAVFFL